MDYSLIALFSFIPAVISIWILTKYFPKIVLVTMLSILAYSLIFNIIALLVEIVVLFFLYANRRITYGKYQLPKAPSKIRSHYDVELAIKNENKVNSRYRFRS